MLGHPVKQIGDYQNKVVPLRIHGDGVPIGKAKKRTLDVLSFSSMVGASGSTWDTRWLMFGLVSGAKVKGGDERGSMDIVWEVLLWSFSVLLRGYWPSHDWDGQSFEGTWRGERIGQPLCGGLRFALFELAADLDYLCNYLGLSHFNSLKPCFRCRCNRSTVPWTALGPDAAWRRELVGPTDWYFMDKHAIFSSPRVGLGLWHVTLDLLHIADLGIAQHIGGSVIYMLVLTRACAAVWKNVSTTFGRSCPMATRS